MPLDDALVCAIDAISREQRDRALGLADGSEAGRMAFSLWTFVLVMNVLPRVADLVGSDGYRPLVAGFVTFVTLGILSHEAVLGPRARFVSIAALALPALLEPWSSALPATSRHELVAFALGAAAGGMAHGGIAATDRRLRDRSRRRSLDELRAHLTPTPPRPFEGTFPLAAVLSALVLVGAGALGVAPVAAPTLALAHLSAWAALSPLAVDTIFVAPWLLGVAWLLARIGAGADGGVPASVAGGLLLWWGLAVVLAAVGRSLTRHRERVEATP